MNKKTIKMENLNTSLRTYTCGGLRKKDEGKKVTLIGWVNRKRDHGGLSFIDLRDRFGVTQIVFRPEQKEVMALIPRIKQEFVITLEGKVRKRPPDMVNPDLSTGEIEVEAENISIVNPSLTPPFVIEEDVKALEELRLKYRYLDLRRRTMLQHFITRNRVAQSIRTYLTKRGFLEVETPILAKTTPEGARDFIVPSRMEKGKFYALAQSPQLYKQILMVAGFDRYYQFAKCLRDEDMRGDRQPEHTQIDIEMSFISEEDIYSLTEGMMKQIFLNARGIEIETPFPRISYAQAIEQYGTDKPDMRIPLKIDDYTTVAQTGSFKVFNDNPVVKGIKIAQVFSRSAINILEKFAQKAGAPGLLWLTRQDDYRGIFVKYFKNLNDFEVSDGETLFLVAGANEMVLSSLGELRKELGKQFIKENDFQFVWVTEFPLFEWNEEEQNWNATHHIFTMPQDSDIARLNEEPGLITGKLYDLVINGEEIASGSIRNHKADVQRTLLKITGFTDEQIEDRFGYLLKALQYGAPPHGGIAPGIDRLCMVLEGL
ncbi:MAG: aspartate--tRNA ligase, partial [Candidatus Cloacimonadota bacterium]